MTPKQAAERILELDKTLYRLYDYEMSRIDPGYIEISNKAPQVAKALLEAIDLLKKYSMTHYSDTLQIGHPTKPIEKVRPIEVEKFLENMK